MKRLLAVSLLALAALVLGPGALSAPPTILRTPIDQTFVDNVDCAFPVQFHIVGTELSIFFDSGREFDAFPNSRATVSIAGPAHIQFGSDGSVTAVGTGPALFFFVFRALPESR
jgi:hypothetical protein